MIRPVVNENSTSWLDVAFLDKDGDPATPSSVTYRVDCLSSGTVIRADTGITAASEVEIVLTPGDNAIVDQDHRVEKRLVTVTATFGAGDQHVSEYVYLVRNLKKVT